MSAEANAGLASTLRTNGAPLLEALGQHAPQAREHSEASGSYAFALAAELGFDRNRCELLRELAKLHEIGQIYVPASVVEKEPADRDVAETAAFDAHYEAGASVARGAGMKDEASEWLLHQRENFDGSGPRGMAGDRIPIESRILRTACVCQTTLAAPDPGDCRDRAIVRLGNGAGNEFDPHVVAALIAILERAA